MLLNSLLKILAVPIIVIIIIIISINIIITSFFFNFYIVCYRHTACLNISAALYLTTQTESSLGQYKLEVSDKKVYTNVLVLSCHLDKLSSPLHAFPNPLLHFLGF